MCYDEYKAGKRCLTSIDSLQLSCAVRCSSARCSSSDPLGWMFLSWGFSVELLGCMIFSRCSSVETHLILMDSEIKAGVCSSIIFLWSWFNSTAMDQCICMHYIVFCGFTHCLCCFLDYWSKWNVPRSLQFVRRGYHTEPVLLYTPLLAIFIGLIWFSVCTAVVLCNGTFAAC